MAERKTIYLCLAHMSEEGWEQKYVKEAFDTNWMVPQGLNVNGLRVTHYTDVSAQVQAMGVEERAIPILEHVLKNHRVTNGEMRKILGVSRATAMRILQKLNPLLESVGQGAGGYYRIRNY